MEKLKFYLSITMTIIVVMSLPVCAQQQDIRSMVMSKINSIRGKYHLDNYSIDTMISKACRMIDTTDTSILKTINKTTQKEALTLLCKGHVFDLNIRSIVLKSDSNGTIDTNNAALIGLLSNKTFNRMGLRISKNGNEVTAKLIFTENYIRFSPRWRYDVEASPGNFSAFNCIISGISYVDDSIFYQTTQLDELPESFIPSSPIKIEFKDSDYYHEKNESKLLLDQQLVYRLEPLLKEKLQDDDLKYFEIALSFPYSNVVFFDSKGKILAFVHFLKNNKGVEH
ncbi:MAG TPA: hypothetical protein VMU30_09675 [Bacteroidota bacterium]|nr:hypothetical protein [Bacteroidota bacterium]